MPRRRARFSISAPVVFRWRHESGGYENGDGITRDIGIGGMFIVTNGPSPPENASIRCEASLPAVDPSRPRWRLRISGLVQRAIYQNNEVTGFAVKTKSFLLSHDDAHSVHITVN